MKTAPPIVVSYCEDQNVEDCKANCCLIVRISMMKIALPIVVSHCEDQEYLKSIISQSVSTCHLSLLQQNGLGITFLFFYL